MNINIITFGDNLGDLMFDMYMETERNSGIFELR